MRYLYLVLSAVIFTAGMLSLENLDRRLNVRGVYWDLKRSKSQMSVISNYLHDYAKSHGHYPSNDEGLLALKKLVRKGDWSKDGIGSYKDAREIACCRTTDSGILGVWGDPFVYENRRNIDPARFSNSEVSKDTARMYSLEVDKNIYIWSLGAKQAYENEYAYWALRLKVARYSISLVSLFLFILFVRGAFRAVNPEVKGIRRILRGMLSILGGIFGGAALSVFITTIGATTFATCYARMAVRPRSPELTKDYISLITKYRDRGIISDMAHKKILAGLKKDEKDERYNSY